MTNSEKTNNRRNFLKMAGAAGLVSAFNVNPLLTEVLAKPAPSLGEGRSLEINLALTGIASASSARTVYPASHAIDGSASTSWSPETTGSGTLVVDLHRVRHLGGVGITLAPKSAPAKVSVALATPSRRWRPVDTVVSAAPGEPVYISLPHRVRATRYARLSVKSRNGSPLYVGEFRLFGKDASVRNMALGADLSFTLQEEAAGNHFTDQGRIAPPERILRAHGANYVRLRLWVNPPPGYSNLENVLTMARRVKAAGMKFLLDIHYSDFWADPSHQTIPKAWQGQNYIQLKSTVYEYTKSVIKALASEDAAPDMVQIGNEITGGMLWPIGKDYGTPYGFTHLAGLIRSGMNGVKDAHAKTHNTKIMIHIDRGGDNSGSRWFYDNLIAAGVKDFDIIGLSYYPFWHGPIADFHANVNDLARRYGKDIVVAETQYPWTLANGDDAANFVGSPDQLTPGYPAGPAGQISFVNDLLSILARVPGGHGAGLFYWEPEWIPGVGYAPGHGNPNDNLALFDFQGHALPSIGLFENPVVVDDAKRKVQIDPRES